MKFLSILGFLLASVASFAQAPANVWTAGHGVSGSPLAAGIEFDDGTGPAVFVSGDFSAIGDAVAPRVARFRHSRFEPAGSSAAIWINDFEVFDDGSGPKLYACGSFPGAGGPHGIAYWNGAAWVGVGGTLQTMSGSTLNDSGAACFAIAQIGGVSVLVVGGGFSHVAGVGGFRGVAAWNGSSYLDIGAGLTTAPGGNPPTFLSMAVSSVAGTPELYAVGTRLANPLASGIYAVACAKYIGGTWINVPMPALGLAPGQNYAPFIAGLRSYDDGAGEKLYLAGGFGTLDSTVTGPLVRFDGAVWAPPPGGPVVVNNVVYNETAGIYSIEKRQNGPNEELVFSGSFDTVGALTAWGTAGFGPGGYVSYGQPGNSSFHSGVLVPFTGLTGPSILKHSQVFDGANWYAADPRQQLKSTSGYVVAQGMTPPSMYGLIGGNLMRRSGPAWEQVAPWPTNAPHQFVFGVARYDAGSGPVDYVGGRFFEGTTRRGVMKLSGGVLVDVGPPLAPAPFTTAFELLTGNVGFGNELIAVGVSLPLPNGTFTRAARWNGTAWNSIGLASGLFPAAYAAAFFDFGAGPKLYIAGSFGGGSNILYWNGTTWVVPGGGITSGLVNTLAVFDDGNGPALYAGGAFPTAGGVSSPGVAKWNGSVWSAVGQGLPHTFGGPFYGPLTLAVYDDESGVGPKLYAGGNFGPSSPFIGGLAKLENGVWVPVPGLNGFTPPTPVILNKLTAFRSFDRPSLYAHGMFFEAGAYPSSGLARLAPETPTPSLDDSDPGLLTLNIQGRIPGRSYLTIFSAEGLGLPVGLGPWGGLYASDPMPLILQASLPYGTEPFLFATTSPDYSFGPLALPAGLFLDVATADVTGDRPILLSGVDRALIR